MNEPKIINDLTQLYKAGIAAVLPSEIIKENITLQQQTVTICNRKTYDLSQGCYAVGFGKAALGMASALQQILQKQLLKGMICVPDGTGTNHPGCTKFEILEGAENNLPDKRAVENAVRVVEFIETLNKDAVVFVLISGGGSALLPYPWNVSLQEKLEVIKVAVASGANIQTLNALRIQLSKTKGGGLARIAYPRKLICLVLSDVVGDDLSIIASGPTTTPPILDIEQILQTYDLKNKLSERVKNILLTNQVNNISTNADNYLIGTNQQALKAIFKKSLELKYNSVIMSSKIQGLVNDVSKTFTKIVQLIQNKDIEFETKMLRILVDELLIEDKDAVNVCRDFKKLSLPVCLIFGGETTVRITGDGIGGRNQQLALQFSVDANEAQLDRTLIACVGSDGFDGPTNAAGAIGCPNQVELAIQQGLHPRDFIDNNDAFNFYSKLANGKYLILTGHTGTNVSDFYILIVL